MNRTIILRKIVNIATDYYNLKNISFSALLSESGFHEMLSSVTENDILGELVKDSTLSDQWFLWSENKRTNSGWYLTNNRNDNYVVGYFPPNGEILNFSNKLKACAAFIKREIEDTEI